MRHLYRNIALIIVVMLICAAALWPPEKNLRLGKDLAGGVSITYAVELAPDDPPSVVDQVIEVLSRRVNPSGLFEISFTKQGRDRIEVSMPLPSQRVQTLRASLDEAIDALGAYTIDAGAVERALRAPEGEREAALDALMTSEPRRALLEPVRDALAAATEARAAYEAARAKGDTPGAELSKLVDAAGSAEEQLDQAKRRAITASVAPEEVRAILRRSTERASITDGNTKRPIALDSPFDKGVNSLRARIGDLPGGTAAIDAVLAANTAYLAEAKGLDDPQDLERLLQGSGVLEFHIAVRPGARPDEQGLRDQLHQRGPSGVQTTGVRWYPVNKATDWFKTVDELAALEADPAAHFRARGLVGDSYAGEYFLLLHDEPGKRLTSAEGNWRLTRVTQTADELGRPAVAFHMDPLGGTLLSAMTEPNVNEPMAVMLDGRVFTAPNINSRLARDVSIEGSFTPQEIAYLQQTLKAGSLSARLSEKPLSMTRLAPELGRDNLEKGIKAGWIALILVAAMMVFYYFLAGFIASLALIVNVLVILGVMSLNRAAFTLPGIAGIILTFGMAVDSNVLIYERLREELQAGHDLKTAVRIAYSRVMNTIVDSNVTTLIACVVLAYTATQEIKGFAITLGIGVVATMFAALFVTRVLFAIIVEKFGVRRMRQLPMVFTFIDRFFRPNIDWVGLRPILWSISALLVGTGIFFVFQQGDNLLDTEFRGGTAVDLRLKDPGADEKIAFEGAPFQGTLKIDQVREAVQQIAAGATERAKADPNDAEARQLQELATATIVAVGRSDGITSDWFRVKTTITDEQLVLDTLMEKFAPVVGSSPPLTFVGSNAADLAQAPVHIVQEPVLGRNDWMAGRTDVVDDVSAFIGGVAIVLKDISPAVSEADLLTRVEFQRAQGENVSQAARRTLDVIVVDGTAADVKTAVILVRDPLVNALFDEARWKTDLAGTEWKMTQEALARASTTASVESFSAEVAATFRAKAIVAVAISLLLITIYIWVRFGSLRYSMAAIVATFHDLIAVIGVISLADVLATHWPSLAVIGIQPYKIDLGLMAAILTIIGYSLNDTIVILDRVRENRGKLPYATRKIINDSVNQTMSRTIITGGSTLVSIVVMFLVGGEGLASFNFALFWGIIIGTFSSIAIAAPIVYTKRIPAAVRPIMEAAEAREMGLAPTEPVPSA